MANTLKIGIGRVCINPAESVPMAGYFNEMFRLSTDVLDDISVTALAFSDEQEKPVLLLSIDSLYMFEDYVPELRAAIEKGTGVPAERVLLHTTHTHSAPDNTIFADERVLRYRALLAEKAAEAGKLALADRAPAELYSARAHTKGLSFVRRYLLNDGDWLGDNCNGSRKKDIVCHESEPDTEMQVLKILRPGKQMLYLCNWQCHPLMTGGFVKTSVSADFIGWLRRKVEARTGAMFTYFTGGAGNLSMRSYVAGEAPTDDVDVYSDMLADVFFSIKDEDFQKEETGAVGLSTIILDGETNHLADDLLKPAQEIEDFFLSTGDRPKAVEMGKVYGFHSPYHAMAIVLKSKLPKTFPIELDALRIGSVSFTTAPFEMFDVTGMEIKAGTPDSMTFVCSCANGYLSYLPSWEASFHKGYENDVTRFLPGTAEKVSGTLVTMLKELAAK